MLYRSHHLPPAGHLNMCQIGASKGRCLLPVYDIRIFVFLTLLPPAGQDTCRLCHLLVGAVLHALPPPGRSNELKMIPLHTCH